MNNETLDYLRKKAAMLPKMPGVYLMKDKIGKIIYVGKSRSLKDRVSQYFHLTKVHYVQKAAKKTWQKSRPKLSKMSKSCL